VDGIRSEQVDASSSVCPDGIVGIRTPGPGISPASSLSSSTAAENHVSSIARKRFFSRLLEPDPKVLAAARSGAIHAYQSTAWWHLEERVGHGGEAKHSGPLRQAASPPLAKPMCRHLNCDVDEIGNADRGSAAAASLSASVGGTAVSSSRSMRSAASGSSKALASTLDRFVNPRPHLWPSRCVGISTAMWTR
jgi:hypothetical protein